MKHKVNNPLHLATIIENAVDGDVIEIPSAASAELAQRARQRMCPCKDITFEVAPPDPMDDAAIEMLLADIRAVSPTEIGVVAG